MNAKDLHPSAVLWLHKDRDLQTWRTTLDGWCAEGWTPTTTLDCGADIAVVMVKDQEAKR